MSCGVRIPKVPPCSRTYSACSRVRTDAPARLLPGKRLPKRMTRPAPGFEALRPRVIQWPAPSALLREASMGSRERMFELKSRFGSHVLAHVIGSNSDTPGLTAGESGSRSGPVRPHDCTPHRLSSPLRGGRDLGREQLCSGRGKRSGRYLPHRHVKPAFAENPSNRVSRSKEAKLILLSIFLHRVSTKKRESLPNSRPAWP